MLILLSVVGGAFSAYLGWLESAEPFDQRKFLASLLRSILGSAVSALALQGIDNVDVFVYLGAFLIGAGVDVIGKRAQAALTSKPAENPAT